MLLSATALDVFPESAAVLDPSGTIVLINRSWREFVCANGGAVRWVGTNYLAVCEAVVGPGRDAQEAGLMASGIRAVLSGERGEFRMPYPCHSPTEQRYFVARVNGFSHHGERYALVVHEDATAQVLAERRARQLNTLLSNASQTLRQVSRAAAHDLQEPLRLVSLYAGLLSERETGLSERGARYLEHIREQATLALGLVGGLQTLTALSLPGRVGRSDLEALLRRVWETLQPPPGARLQLDCAGLDLRGDPEQLEELFGQLLGNALRFGGAPVRVRVRARFVPGGSGALTSEGGEVDLTLEDNGPGIPTEHRQQVLGLYRRLHPRGGGGGLGLGLSIAQMVVLQHGGHMALEDGDCGGLRVRLRLPGGAARVQSPESQTPESQTSESQTSEPQAPEAGL